MYFKRIMLRTSWNLKRQISHVNLLIYTEKSERSTNTITISSKKRYVYDSTEYNHLRTSQCPAVAGAQFPLGLWIQSWRRKLGSRLNYHWRNPPQWMDETENKRPRLKSLEVSIRSVSLKLTRKHGMWD